MKTKHSLKLKKKKKKKIYLSYFNFKKMFRYLEIIIGNILYFWNHKTVFFYLKNIYHNFSTKIYF